MTEYVGYAVYLIAVLLFVVILYLRDIDLGIEWLSGQISRLHDAMACLPGEIKRAGILHGSDTADMDLFE